MNHNPAISDLESRFIICSFHSNGEPRNRRFDTRNGHSMDALIKLIRWATHAGETVTLRPMAAEEVEL